MLVTHYNPTLLDWSHQCLHSLGRREWVRITPGVVVESKSVCREVSTTLLSFFFLNKSGLMMIRLVRVQLYSIRFVALIICKLCFFFTPKRDLKDNSKCTEKWLTFRNYVTINMANCVHICGMYPGKLQVFLFYVNRRAT